MDNAEQIQALQGAVLRLRDLTNSVEDLFYSLEGVDEIFQSITVNNTFPQVIPELKFALLSIYDINKAIDSLTKALQVISVTSSLENDINSLNSYIKSFVQLLYNYYNQAMQTQTYQAQSQLLAAQSASISSMISHTQTELQAIDLSSVLLLQLKEMATFQAVLSLIAEQKHVNFYALQDNQLNLPQNPTSTQISQIQNRLQSQITIAQSQHNTKLQSWGNFTLTKTLNPTFFNSLAANYSATFSIDLPPVKSSYYDVQMIDIQVYPFPLANFNNSFVDISLYQLGLNNFFDQHYNYWNFTLPNNEYPFKFSTLNYCPLSRPDYLSQINYAMYSPYGNWQLIFPHPTQLNIASVEQIEIYIKLKYNYYSSGGEDLWGNYNLPFQIITYPFSC